MGSRVLFEDRAISHGGEDRGQPLPGDVFVAALDAGDRALARAGAVGELALAEAVARAELA